jgi:hypothetical protein
MDWVVVYTIIFLTVHFWTLAQNLTSRRGAAIFVLAHLFLLPMAGRIFGWW